MAERNPQHLRMMQHFATNHLPAHLREISKPFSELADLVVDWSAEGLMDPEETTVALRKLLESKDAAVRAAVVGSDGC